MIIARDVTERTKTEQALRQSEQRFRVLAEASNYLVTEFDEEGRLIYASPNCTGLLGTTPEEMIGTIRVANAHPDDKEHGIGAFLDGMKSVGPAKPSSLRIRHRDGRTRWFECSGVDYRSAGGSIHRVAVCRDISESRHEDEPS